MPEAIELLFNNRLIFFADVPTYTYLTNILTILQMHSCSLHQGINIICEFEMLFYEPKIMAHC